MTDSRERETCPACGGRFPLGEGMPEGAAVHPWDREPSGTGWDGRPLDGRKLTAQWRAAATPRFLKHRGIWVLLDRDGWYARPPCGNPREIIAFRGEGAYRMARRAAHRWNGRARPRTSAELMERMRRWRDR